jgi:hypothetical protein
VRLAAVAAGTVTAAPPLLFGVDAVPVERVRKLLPAYGDRFARRLATRAEAAWAGGSAERLAALFAVKEAAVKCLAGRPPGFRWQTVELAVEPGVEPGPGPGVEPGPEPGPGPGAGPPAVSGAVAATFEAFAAGVELDAGADVACRLTGVALDRGLELMHAAPWGTVRGMARYGTRGDTVLAVVAFWEEPA